ncbi:MAG: S8 family serine peptidase [Armatimonadetes bacterium]|nr:S8 family serine peptidase [Armatimonadota bacterium]
MAKRLWLLSCSLCVGSSALAQSGMLQAAPGWRNNGFEESLRRTKVATGARVQARFTGRILIKSPAGISKAAKTLPGLSNWAWIDFGSNADPNMARSEAMRKFPGSQVFAVYDSGIVRDSFTPNDPYYFAGNPDASWPGQWYLKNGVTPGLDTGVWNAWQADFTGFGVTVGVVDDGLQTGHPDLTANYTATNSYDFGQNDSNPNPVVGADNHGTAVAGLIGARGGNSIGITGSAPEAKLAGLRLNFDAASADFTTQDAAATLYRSSGTTTAIRLKNHSYGPTVPYSLDTAQATAIADSASVGTIHVRSAGNSRGGTAEDVNKFLERNIPQTIVVGAVQSDGKYGPYSGFGASLTCVAPSSPNSVGFLLQETTDRVGESEGYNGGSDSFPDGNYTSIFGFTSGAAPLVTGALALVRQAIPTMNVRFAKHLIALTAKKVDPADTSTASDGGWKTNAAGYSFNQNYGFGLIDASAMIALEPYYSGVTALTTSTTGTVTVNQAIPDNSTTGTSKTFQISNHGKLEEMMITLNITHTWRGDLEAYLTSPSGTTSRLFIQAGSDNGTNLAWTFTSNAFWGEDPFGTWTIKVMDLGLLDSGTFNSLSATANMGELVAVNSTIMGNVNLGDWLGALAGQEVTFELRDSQDTVVETQSLPLDASGNYTFITNLQGTYTLTAKASHWLRGRSATLTLNGSPLTGKDFSLANGDIDRDNAITIFDYLYLSSAFDKNSGDSDWNVADSEGVRPSDSDLDGDETVSIFDYVILNQNFDLTGEG